MRILQCQWFGDSDSCTFFIILSYFVLRLSQFTPSASMFTLSIFILSNKSSTSLSAKLKVRSSSLLTWLFLIVFVKFCAVPTTSGQFVPQCFACLWTGHCKGKISRNSIYPQNVNMDFFGKSNTVVRRSFIKRLQKSISQFFQFFSWETFFSGENDAGS